jgi:four helix bundle protein
MNPNQTATNAAPRAPAAMFDHEKLDVYQMELQFITWVTPLLGEVANSEVGRTREVCDQLDRASLSALLNTAEGNGKRQRQVRAKFFDDARGSATECAACLDALVAKKVASQDRIISGKQMPVRIVSMLCGLVDRFDTANALHEEESEIQTNRITQPVSYLKSRTRTRTRTRTKKI